MGCCTGNYLIVKGEFESSEIVPLVISTMEFIASFNGDIPGASPAECGNYSFMDLEGAKAIAKQYLEEVLYCIEESNLIYPQ